MTHVEYSGMDYVVSLALLMAAAFTIAWALSPKLRVWIERPNLKFAAQFKRSSR